MVDEEPILRKLAELEEYLKQIREFEHTDVQTYVSDWKTQRIVERTLQILIETCADIAGHIIADRGLRVPNSYADAFKVLQEAGIISQGLLSNMAKMSKFMNIIVHQFSLCPFGFELSTSPPYALCPGYI